MNGIDDKIISIQFVMAILLLFLINHGLKSQSYDPVDSLALLNIDGSCDGLNTLNWDIEPDPGNWTGVTWSDGAPKKVTGLVISGKSLTGAMDATQLSDLSLFICGANQLTGIDISPPSALVYFDCSYNELSDLDVSDIFLSMLDCAGNDLTSLKMSPGLSEVYCADNLLTELDISSLTELRALHCDSNQLSELDLTAAVYLEALLCSGNHLTSLDISKQSGLIRLECFGNDLSYIDVSGSPVLNEFRCYNNRLPFSSLATGLHVLFFDYSPQDTLYGPQTTEGDTTIDYSPEALIDGTATEFVFFRNSEEAGTNTSGMYTTNGPGVYHCEMTNARFPGLTLITAAVTVLPGSGVENDVPGGIRIYPNPVTDWLKLDIPGGMPFQVEMSDASGKQLINAGDVYEIDMSGWPDGSYCIRIRFEDSILVKGIIKR